jgi:hypothetical protein
MFYQAQFVRYPIKYYDYYDFWGMRNNQVFSPCLNIDLTNIKTPPPGFENNETIISPRSDLSQSASPYSPRSEVSSELISPRSDDSFFTKGEDCELESPKSVSPVKHNKKHKRKIVYVKTKQKGYHNFR